MTMFYPIIDNKASRHYHDLPLWALLDEDEPAWSCAGPYRNRSFRQHRQRRAQPPPFIPSVFRVKLSNKDAQTTESKSRESAPAVPRQPAFEVKLDVSDFLPQELSVKTVGNNIVIEGKHEEKDDGHGFVSRSLMRRFVVPENVKPENVKCKLTPDGLLVLSAPLAVEVSAIKERSIPIFLSNQPATSLATFTEAAAALEQSKPAEHSATAATPEQPKATETPEYPTVEVEDLGDEDTGSGHSSMN